MKEHLYRRSISSYRRRGRFLIGLPGSGTKEYMRDSSGPWPPLEEEAYELEASCAYGYGVGTDARLSASVADAGARAT
jgi:hypothetical protein